VNPGFLPFHAGEKAAQHLAGVDVAQAPIRPFMPDQHRDFFASLPLLWVALPDADGAPLATVLAGEPGFIGSPDPQRLTIAALPAAPLALRRGAPIGLLGLEHHTRRRNRANGHVEGIGPEGFSVRVEESFGNCPRFITPREAWPAPRERATLALATLDADARALIGATDTAFIATSGAETGGMDMSHRGGPPGFLALDGETVTIPDFPGNRFFNTLGNLLLEQRAALLVPDFAQGRALLLQGRAETRWEGERAVLFHVEHAWWQEGVLPFRWV
jgi:predicted pyridoxine 5'-phosphate oxidase superfamily flavin-nucleotide-binding protein